MLTGNTCVTYLKRDIHEVLDQLWPLAVLLFSRVGGGRMERLVETRVFLGFGRISS